MNRKKYSIDWSTAMKKIDKQNNSKANYKDERIYYPKLKDDGTGEAVIRFLPAPDTEVPFALTYSHGFRDIGGWMIEGCPTTIAGKQCPVCKANTIAWKAGDEETARQRARKTHYYANILVVKDPQTPENEGKVFLFKYGKKIGGKIMDQIQPPSGGIDEPVMVFDWYEGADFKLKIKKVKTGNTSYPNYDESQFIAPKALTEKKIEEIETTRYNILEFFAEDKFKPYAELEAQLARVLNTDVPATGTAQKSGSENVTEQADESAPTEKVFDEDDDTFFENLEKS